LIYSTCSYSKDEDETIADWLVDECQLSSIKLQVKETWNIVETKSDRHQAYGYRFYPDKMKGEGFYIAAFKKKESEGLASLSAKQKNKAVKIPMTTIDLLRPFLIDADDHFYFRQHEEMIALPLSFEKELPFIQSALYIKKAGIKLGTIIRNELIPDHELALSTIINPGVRSVAVDETTALQYLRRQEIKLPGISAGWSLLCYQQVPLGWVKILPGRVNNYYPASWRILNK
jgi:NOL1/NOP2/fmu family ribosome biogenesis protein